MDKLVVASLEEERKGNLALEMEASDWRELLQARVSRCVGNLVSLGEIAELVAKVEERRVEGGRRRGKEEKGNGLGKEGNECGRSKVWE